MKISLKEINHVSLLLSFGFVATCMMWYIFIGYEHHLHSDSASKVLLSKLILESGEFLPSSWVYVNGDIRLGLPEFPLFLLISIIEDTFLAYSLNSFFYLCVCYFSLNYLICELKLVNEDKWLLRVLFFTGISIYYVSFLFGEIAYLPLLILFFIITGDFVKVVINGDILSNKYILIRCFIYIFFFAHNPSKFLIFSIFPYIFAGICLYVRSETFIKRYLKAALMLIVSFICSLVIYYPIKSMVINANGAANITVANSTVVQNNILEFFPDFLMFIGMSFGSGSSAFSVISIYMVLVFAFLIYFIFEVSSIGALKFARSERAINLFWFAKYLFVGYLFITFFFYIFYTPLAVDVGSIRYFYPVFWSMLLLTALYITNQEGTKKTLLVIFLVLFSILGSYLSYISPSSNKSHGNSDLSKVSDVIIQSGLKKGYATYWNTGATEVKGDSKFEISPVHISTFEPFKWLTDLNRFKVQDNYSTFFLAAPDEVTTFEKMMVTRRFKEPIKVKAIANYKLYIFDYDIAVYFYGKYIAAIEDGIHFNIKGYPSFLSEVKGMSSFENSHRWTDGPYAEFNFKDTLPKSFKLTILASPYGPNIGRKILVKVGDKSQEFIMKGGFNEYLFNFENVNSSQIKFVIPKPTQVLNSNGEITDSRYLGIAFKSIELTNAG